MLEINKKTIFQIFLGVAACIILRWLLSERENVKHFLDVFFDILSPFIIGGCIAFIANVPMRFFENKLVKIEQPGLKRAVALIITFVAVAIVLGGVFLLLIPQLIETIEMLIPAVYDFFLELGVSIEKFMQDNPDAMSLLQTVPSGNSFDLSALLQNSVAFLGNSVSAILQRAVSTIGSVASFAMDLFVAIVLDRKSVV